MKGSYQISDMPEPMQKDESVKTYIQQTKTSPLTEQEYSELKKKKNKVFEEPYYVRRMIGENRLKFVHYLIEHGELSENTRDQESDVL